jgi:hypothetical protein
VTLETFRRRLPDPDPEVRAYCVGKLLRQAKPDDALSFVSLRAVDELWPLLERYLGRSELRDLWDVAALPEAGGDLHRALADAPGQDAGFSPAVLAWILEQLPIRRLAAALAYAEELVVRLERFRGEAVERILAAAVPV